MMLLNSTAWYYNDSMILVWMAIIFIQGHRDVRKLNFCANYVTKFTFMEFQVLLKLVGVINLILMLSHLIGVQEKSPTLACILTLTNHFLSNLVWS